MKPYYEDGSVTIYHGDWREMDDLWFGADALVTDPPYGIGADRMQSARAGVQAGNAIAPSKDYGWTDWDAAPPTSEEMARLLLIGTRHIIWGGNYFSLPPMAGWLVWDKETGANTYADCEMAWTDIPMAAKLKRFQWKGMFQAIKEDRWHPTQKPLPIMRWALGFLPTADLIVDPYMGSGTTLVAAKDLGKRAIGIEIEERYCEVAAIRCSQETLGLTA